MSKIHDPSSTNDPDDNSLDRLFDFYQKYRHILWTVFTFLSLVGLILLVPVYYRSAVVHALVSQRFLVVMLILFSLITLSLLWTIGQRLDAWAFLYFNLRGIRPAWLDWLMLGITQGGNGLTGVIIALAFFSIGNFRLSYELILGILSLWLVVEFVKAIIRRSRPFVKIASARIVGYRARGRSFPSGHTSQAFFLVTLLDKHFQLGAWGVFLYILAVLVAITRMYVGAHYPRDVLAGAILGSVWGILGMIVEASLGG